MNNKNELKTYGLIIKIQGNGTLTVDAYLVEYKNIKFNINNKVKQRKLKWTIVNSKAMGKRTSRWLNDQEEGINKMGILEWRER